MEASNGGLQDTITTIYRSDRISDIVITTVAKTKGVDPLDLDPLYDVVDPDALDSLFAATTGSEASSLDVRFTMAGCDVVVRGDGIVDVTPPGGDAVSPDCTDSDD